MEFDLTGRKPYVIQDNENGCYIFDHIGFAMEAEQMVQLAERLLKTAKAKGKKNEIEEYNKERNKELTAMYGGGSFNSTKKPKPKKLSFVYMLECGGKYKVGVSQNIERRVSELDKRPFPVKAIAVSEPSADAYDYEQYIHEKLKHLRISGEWYEISPAGVEKVKKYIERIS